MSFFGDIVNAVEHVGSSVAHAIATPVDTVVHTAESVVSKIAVPVDKIAHQITAHAGEIASVVSFLPIPGAGAVATAIRTAADKGWLAQAQAKLDAFAGVGQPILPPRLLARPMTALQRK